MKGADFKSILLLFLAIPAATYLGRELGGSAAEQANERDAARAAATTPAPSQSPKTELRVVASSQDAEGVTQDQLDLTFLKNFEAYTVERVKVRANEYLASIGLPPSDVAMESEATYVDAGARRLVVIRLRGEGIRQVYIAGIVGPELRRVVCLRESEENIPVTYGACGEKIEEVFGAKIDV